MNGFYQNNGVYFADGVPLADIARAAATPCYVFSRAALAANYRAVRAAFAKSGAAICYAVKANDNLSLLKILAGEGAGFDIVSGGELARVLAAYTALGGGGRAADVVFSGVGKSAAEISAALAAGVGCFNVESAGELARIEECAAAAEKTAPVALRVTFNIDGGTHRHLTTGLAEGKFGVAAAEARALAKRAGESAHLQFLGFSAHIGSQIADEKIYLQLAEMMAEQVRQSEADGLPVLRVDMGGGFAVADGEINPPPPQLQDYDAALAKHFGGKKLLIEPGRSIVCSAGVLLTTVEYVKEAGDKTIWITDAGMNDFLRPALYGAELPIVAVDGGGGGGGGEEARGDIAGPVCENADFFARGVALKARAGTVLAVFNAGAYGLTMASNYNARPRPAAVLTDKGNFSIIRRRETIDEMLAAEKI